MNTLLRSAFRAACFITTTPYLANFSNSPVHCPPRVGFLTREEQHRGQVAGPRATSKVGVTPILRKYSEYRSNGFAVFASQESFSGPGPSGGAKQKWGSATSDWYRDEPQARGGGFVAVRFGSSGEPLEIAHIVTNKNGRRKGGASSASNGDVGALTAEGAANLLKSRFSDRSQLLSVDLKSGRAGYSTPPLLSTGGASSGKDLSVSLIYSGP